MADEMPAFAIPVPGVGVCQNDLVFFAQRVLAVLQVSPGGSLTSERIRKEAMFQAAFDLGMLCDQMQGPKVEAGNFENALRRLQSILECAGECADTLATLATLPSLASPKGNEAGDGETAVVS